MRLNVSLNDAKKNSYSPEITIKTFPSQENKIILSTIIPLDTKNITHNLRDTYLLIWVDINNINKTNQFEGQFLKVHPSNISNKSSSKKKQTILGFNVSNLNQFQLLVWKIGLIAIIFYIIPFLIILIAFLKWMSASDESEVGYMVKN